MVFILPIVRNEYAFYFYFFKIRILLRTPPIQAKIFSQSLGIHALITSFLQHQILCASSHFHNTCIMSSSFTLQLGHHGCVRTLLFTRLAHAGRMLWHALHANILTLLETFAFQIKHQTISMLHANILYILFIFSYQTRNSVGTPAKKKKVTRKILSEIRPLIIEKGRKI